MPQGRVSTYDQRTISVVPKGWGPRRSMAGPTGWQGLQPVVFNFGEKGCGLRTGSEVQDFYKIRDQCLRSNRLFEDSEFPANDNSLFFTPRRHDNVVWKRPKELCARPELYIEGQSKFDTLQGDVGDCWLLAAMAGLIQSNHLLRQVVPDDQDFYTNYAGIFHFRFWQYGRWVDVVIDDRLPAFNRGGRLELIYLRSTQGNEFWGSLLEKAYAKLHGCYEALDGGLSGEAMEDFTGGVAEVHLLENSARILSIIVKAFERSSLVGCAIRADPGMRETRSPAGFVVGHAYSITSIISLDATVNNVRRTWNLVRLKNPWGNLSEWKGAWCINSAEWKAIPQDMKKRTGLVLTGEGDFWMAFEDFARHFTFMEICNLSPDSLSQTMLGGKSWQMSVYEGEWVRGMSAGGGSETDLATFWINPQYRISLMEADDNQRDCEIIVALMQKNRRAKRRLGLQDLAIGFEIFHIADPRRIHRPLDITFFRRTRCMVRYPFTSFREILVRLKIPRGVYIIVPATVRAGMEGEFILRVFSENDSDMQMHDKAIGLGTVNPKVATALTRLGKARRISSQTAATFKQAEEIGLTPEIQQMFIQTAGEDLELDWIQLRELLRMTLQTSEEFSKDVCRSMVAMMDEDRSGKMGLEEFTILFKNLLIWKEVYDLYEKDQYGNMYSYMFRLAITDAGYNVNNQLLNLISRRYATQNGMINFNDFMMCAIKLKAMIDMFQERDPADLRHATFTLDEWVEKTIYS